MIMWYFFTTIAPPLSFFSFPMTIYSVFYTSVKISGGAHHYLPCKTSLKFCFVMLCWLGYVKVVRLGYGYVMVRFKLG